MAQVYDFKDTLKTRKRRKEKKRMEVTIGQIVDFATFPAFQSLLNNKSVPVKYGYKLAMLAKKLSDHVDMFGKKREELVAAYATKGEDGQPLIEDNKFQIPPDKIKAWNDEMVAFRSEKIELEISPVRIRSDEFPDGILSPLEIAVFEPFVAFID